MNCSHLYLCVCGGGGGRCGGLCEVAIGDAQLALGVIVVPTRLSEFPYSGFPKVLFAKGGRESTRKHKGLKSCSS